MIIKIEELIREPENPRLEFKENIKPIDKILATIIAFANGGGGKLIIGVTDKERYIVGVNDPHEISEVLANKIYDTIEPKILPNIEIIPYRNTYIIVIEIFPSPNKPHFIQSSKTGKRETYIRIASTTRTADAALINVIERSKFPKHYDEELCFEAKCEELNFTLLSQLIEHKRKLQDSDLITLGLLAQNGKNLIPTVAGVILFGREHLKYFPHAFIKLGVFAGINKEKILNDQKVESFLPNGIEEVLNFIRKNIDIEIRIEDIQNQEIWEIPKIALREIIINAIVHTDYSLSGSPITIAIFKDRIEIENNALLPWGLSFEELKSGISKLRNPVIARIFKEIGLIEQWGSGLTRAINACQTAGLKSPQFEEIGARIRVTFYKEKIKEPMVTGHTNQLIIELISICGLLSTNKIANFFGKNRRSVISILNNLKNADQIIEVSKSINDPKKKYTTKTGKKIRENSIQNITWTTNNLIQESYTNKASAEFLVLKIKLGKFNLDFCIKEEVLESNFLDYVPNNRQKWKEEVLEVVKNKYISEPEFFIEPALTTIVKNDFLKTLEKKNITQIEILQENCLKDFKR